MRHFQAFFRGGLILAVCCLVLASDRLADACSIPVFRYALERWYPDYYEAVVIHRGPLSEANQQLVDKMRAAAENEEEPANLRVILVDLDEVEKAEEGTGPPKELLDEYADLKSPQLRVHYPPYGPQRWLAWKGALNQQNVDAVIDSPLRQEIIKRLLDGDSSVWVLIESGDAQKDAEAEKILRQGLAEMEKALELPPQEVMQAEQEWQPDTQVDLRIGFSMVRLKRDDPREQVFLSMLLNSEPDLAEFEEPIAIPMFGRGRTFFALVGKGINIENIQDNCYFICGDCSCQIKEQNPGMDMIMAVNWDAHILGSAFRDVELPELTGVGGLEIADLEPIDAAETAQPERMDEAEASAEDSADATESSGSAAVTEPAPKDIQLAQATRRDEVDQSPAPAAMAVGDSASPARDSAADTTTATAHASDGSAPVAPSAETVGGFSTRLLIWIVAGAVLAAVVILSSSYWMRSRQGAG